MKLEYRLLRGEILLGELFDQTVDMPWFDCKFVPTPEFEQVRALLDERNHDELIRQGVRLADADTGENAILGLGYGLPLSFFIDGDWARFSTG